MTADFAIPYGYADERGAFPSYTDARHLCTFGPTRSGKGATIIVHALLTMQHSVVVIDPKGQNAALTARWRRAMGHDVYCINPFGLHTKTPWDLPRHRYNPLAHISIDDPNAVALVNALAQALIQTQGREPYFDDTARDLVTAIMLHLIATLGEKATLGIMRSWIAAIAARSREGLAHLNAMNKSPHGFVRQPIGRFNDAEARDIASAINTAMTQTSMLDNPALTDPALGGTLTGSDFSWLQLKRRPTTVYVMVPGMFMEAFARFLRLMVTSALDHTTSEPGGYPVVFLLDEFARLENLPAVTSAFGFSAGFNVQLWPFLQDLPQLEHVYGKQWMSILANCGLIQFFTPVDVQTAEYLQRRGGHMKVDRRSHTFGGWWRTERSETRSKDRVPLLSFERMFSYPQDQSLVFFAGEHNPLSVGRANYWEIPRLSGCFDPDPYHL